MKSEYTSGDARRSLSRGPSRPSTPSPNPNRSAPSRLAIPPTLRASSSLTNLRVHAQPTPPPVPPLPASVLNSSASSVANLDLTEGILIQDLDAEVEPIDTDEGIAIGHLDTSARTEDSKKSLRDQLRKTLTQRSVRQADRPTPSREPTKQVDINELSLKAASRFSPREYFVLTDAGKPVFVSRPGGDDMDGMTSMIGIIQALISVFIDDNDKLRCINAGRTRITFLMRTPLYYVCASSWGEPESVTRSHLEYLHLQILSIVTAAQLRRIFERRTNFDLRRLLNGAESFLLSMLSRLEFDVGMSISALHCLRLDPVIRKRLADNMVPNPKVVKDILYVVLVGHGRVISLIRPKKHSIHPADIQILLNTVHNPSILNGPAPSSWVPVCLPKFNPSGFVNAYTSFLRRDIDAPPDESDKRSTNSTLDERTGSKHEQSIDPEIALICISGGVEFESVRGWCDSVAQKMRSDGTLDALGHSIVSGGSDYTVSELGIPGLRHFIYKSRAQVQVTYPIFEDPYDTPNEQRRIMTLYQILHDAIHAKSGQDETLKLQYIRTEQESTMGWITQPFELYISLSPRLPKSAAVGAANAVARWVKREENRLFLKDAPVF